MKGVVAVPHQKTFLLVGGRTETFLSHYFLDGLFWYNGERDVWQRCRYTDSIDSLSKFSRKFSFIIVQIHKIVYCQIKNC